MQKFNFSLKCGFLEIIAVFVVTFSFYLAVKYAYQPPLDVHSFRQTQTALTAYWFTQQGFTWAYETPVGGAPWAIPFEFPIYQLVVALISKGFDFSLDASGRLISYVFLFLSIFPIRSITKKLNLPDSVFVFFVAIFFSMPIYLYWGRSFMIETAALFFGIATIKYFVDYLLGMRSFAVALFFIVFSSLSVLQKATTALPILGVLSLIFIVFEIRKAKTANSPIFSRRVLGAGLLILIPVVIGFGWVVFTDHVKLMNPLGGQLTSAELSRWNWGTISQKLSSDIWVKVVWKRIFRPNMGGVIGLFLLITPFIARIEFRVKAIALSALSLGIVPLFLFTNLHLVHDYYQTANVVFLAYGLAIALGMVILPTLGKRVSVLMLIIIVSSNYLALRSGYFPHIKNVFTKENRDLAIGEILSRELPDGMQFVAFGNDWSSTFAYISKRKSFTVPGWYRDYDQVVSNPEKFVEEGRLGAIVSCSVDHPNTFELINWGNKGRSWKIGETHGCLIATPEKKLEAILWKPILCIGSIDNVEIESRNGHRFISLAGWTATTSDKPEIPDDVFLSISRRDSAPVYLQALKVPRLDVNKHLGISNDIDTGFSRILSADLKPGSYEIEILQYSNGRYNSCGIRKTVQVSPDVS